MLPMQGARADPSRDPITRAQPDRGVDAQSGRDHTMQREAALFSETMRIHRAQAYREDAVELG